ncbi:MAG: imidazole glycerol phosphate synthase subunit HisH [Legionellales bacterium]|nr:imidazole glycerol phosphate synthase subunit HisH [Legionellales bacterium]
MIAVITGCGSNIGSVANALQRLACDYQLTEDPQTIRQASHVILPGVGSAQMAMQRLAKLQLISVIQQLTQPVLGICLGMQLLYDYSAEGDTLGLGIIPGKVRSLANDLNERRIEYPVPHMGWNQLTQCDQAHPLWCGIANSAYVYFVHSFYAPINDYTLAITDYGVPFSSMIQRDNFYAMQFHPERSSEIGGKLLANFITDQS